MHLAELNAASIDKEQSTKEESEGRPPLLSSCTALAY
jgi:hypothetical protein